MEHQPIIRDHWRSPDLRHVVSIDTLPWCSDRYGLLRRQDFFAPAVLQAFDLRNVTRAQLKGCVLLSQQRGHGWSVSTFRFRKEMRHIQRTLKNIKDDIASTSANARAPRMNQSMGNRNSKRHAGSSSSSSSSSSKRRALEAEGHQAAKRAKSANKAAVSLAGRSAMESGSPSAGVLLQSAAAARGEADSVSTAQRKLAFGGDSLHSRAVAALTSSPVLFPSNVEVNGPRWEKELRVLLEHLPSGLQPKGAATMLAHAGNVLGVNTVQMFVKTRGCTTPGHQENNNFVSININLGPGTCVWYGVRACHLQKMKQLCKEKGVKFCGGSNGWWPDVQDLQDACIDFECFEQQANEAVLVMPGTLHWVRALGTCANVSWNLAPYSALQFISGFHSTRPLVSMSHLARKVLALAEPPSDCGLVGAMIDVLCFAVAKAERFWEDESMGAHPVEEAHVVCVHCKGDLGNVFFSTSTEHVYCIPCRDKLVAAVRDQLGLTEEEEGTPTRAEIDAALLERFDNKEDPEQLFHTFFYFQDRRQMQQLVNRAIGHYRRVSRTHNDEGAEPSHRAIARKWCRETGIEGVALSLWDGPHTHWAISGKEQKKEEDAETEQEDEKVDGEAVGREAEKHHHGDGDDDDDDDGEEKGKQVKEDESCADHGDQGHDGGNDDNGDGNEDGGAGDGTGAADPQQQKKGQQQPQQQEKQQEEDAEADKDEEAGQRQGNSHTVADGTVRETVAPANVPRGTAVWELEPLPFALMGMDSSCAYLIWKACAHEERVDTTLLPQAADWRPPGSPPSTNNPRPRPLFSSWPRPPEC